MGPSTVSVRKLPRLFGGPWFLSEYGSLESSEPLLQLGIILRKWWGEKIALSEEASIRFGRAVEECPRETKQACLRVYCCQ